MCDAVSIIFAAVSIIGSVAANNAANDAADRQTHAIEAQNQIQADEISDQKGAELDAQARAARRERAAARVSAAESGINLGSNSFLAMLQNSEVNQAINSGLILKNANNAQRARQAETNSLLAGITKKTGLGIALDATQAGVQGYLAGGGKTYLGKNRGPG